MLKLSLPGLLLLAGQGTLQAAPGDQALIIEYELSRIAFADELYTGDSTHLGFTLAYAINRDYEIGFNFSNNFLFSPSLDKEPEPGELEDLITEARLLYLRRNWQINDRTTGFLLLGYSQFEIQSDAVYYCLFFCPGSNLLGSDTTYRSRESGMAWGVGAEWRLAPDQFWSLKYIDYSDTDFDFAGIHLSYRQRLGSGPGAKKNNTPFEFVKTGPNEPEPQATTAQPITGANLTGNWTSEITSDSYWVFIKKYQHLVINLDQQGNAISASDADHHVKIHGRYAGDRVSFELEPGRASGFYDAIGEWRVSEDGSRLEGRWESKGLNASGQWNLQRID